MSIFGKDDSVADAASRLSEEAIYETIANEMKAGERRDGLWIKAYAEANGDEFVANSIYIELRKQSIIDELEIMQDVERKQKNEESLKEKNRIAAKQKLKKEIEKAESESDWLSFFAWVFYGSAALFLLVGIVYELALSLVSIPFAILGTRMRVSYKNKLNEIRAAKSVLTAHSI